MIKQKEKNSPFTIKVIDDPNKLIPFETRRVIKYLRHYPSSVKNGYAKNLRFPQKIDPTNPPSLTYKTINKIVQEEFIETEQLYMVYAVSLREAGEQIKDIIPYVEDLYGFKLFGEYFVGPSAYGTIASPSDPIFVRIPQLRPELYRKNYRTDLELLTHEILAHRLTQDLRDGTGISDNPNSTFHMHAEYLMDIIGRTILTETKLINKNDVKIMRKAKLEAQEDVDPIYYDEDGNIAWRGKVHELFKKVILHLKSK